MDRIIDSNLDVSDDEISLRPLSLDDYIGQSALKSNLRVFLKAALMRNEPIDHILLYGSPGLGKTTLAHIVANEMGSNIITTSGPAIEKPGDLAAILSTLEAGDVLFIDEIHRLSKTIEEILYPALEDFNLDIVVGKEGSARTIKIELPPFTLVGATTRAGDLSSPLRDRFGITFKLDYYNDQELTQIVHRTAKVFCKEIDGDAALEVAKRSRGTPRIANRLFRRIRDFADVEGLNRIDLLLAKTALNELKIDELGLDEVDHRLLRGIIERFSGGPVGLDALANSIGEEVTTLEDVYEPYLLQIGFINRTNRGRIITSKCLEYLNR